ncbi:MAG: hypothetical protein AB7K52_02760 [Phycisphaerales bacterium]
MSGHAPRSLMHNLGAFFGHIFKAAGQDVSRPPAPPPPLRVRHEVRQEARPTSVGPVVLRRTVIEEVELPSPPHPAQPPTPGVRP